MGASTNTGGSAAGGGTTRTIESLTTEFGLVDYSRDAVLQAFGATLQPHWQRLQPFARMNWALFLMGPTLAT